MALVGSFVQAKIVSSKILAADGSAVGKEGLKIVVLIVLLIAVVNSNLNEDVCPQEVCLTSFIWPTVQCTGVIATK